MIKSFDCNRLLGSHHSSPLRTDRDNIAASTAGITTGSFAYASHSSCCNATRYLTKAPNNAAPTISGDAVKRCCRCSNVSTCPNSSTSVPASKRTNRQSVREAWKGLQKPEDVLQISESKNSVTDSKTVAMTGIGDAFVKSGSPVQVRSSA